MINRFKISKSSLENFSYLSLLNLLNMAFPIVIIPLLLSRLGSERYGIFVNGIAIAQIFSVLVKLSYDLIGAREISIHRNDSFSKSKTFSIITYSKILLFFGLILFLRC